MQSRVGPPPHGGVPAVGPREFLRVYDTHRRCFTFRGEEFDIPNIVSVLSTVRSRAAKRMSTLPEAMQSAPDTGSPPLPGPASVAVSAARSGPARSRLRVVRCVEQR